MKQLLLGLGIILFSACQLTVPADNQGVFMSGGQMSDFIVRGKVLDSYQNTYNAKAIPGYLSVFETSGDYLTSAVYFLIEYSKTKHYTRPFKTSKNLLVDDAWELSLKEIAYNRTTKIWQESFSEANKSSLRSRIIFSYPLATLKSTIGSAVMIPIGTTMSSFYTVAGIAYPVIYIPTAPIVGASFSTINATVIFFSGIAWNSIAAPIGALVANPPSPETFEENFFTMTPDVMYAEDQRMLLIERQATLNEVKSQIESSFSFLDSSLLKATQNEKRLLSELDTTRTEIDVLSTQYADSIKNDAKLKALIEKLSERKTIYTKDDLLKMTEPLFKNLHAKDRQAINDYIFTTYQKACEEPINRRLPNIKKNECTCEQEQPITQKKCTFRKDFSYNFRF